MESGALPVLRRGGGILKITAKTGDRFAGGQHRKGDETTKEEHNFEDVFARFHFVLLIIHIFIPFWARTK